MTPENARKRVEELRPQLEAMLNQYASGEKQLKILENQIATSRGRLEAFLEIANEKPEVPKSEDQPDSEGEE
jgi:exonuclease VII small subunit